MYMLDSPFPQPLSRCSLVFLLVWEMYFILRTFLHRITSSFRSTCPYQRSQCSAVIPMLCHLYLVSLSAPYFEICFFHNATLSDHSHLCSLKCHHIFCPYRPGLTFMQHTRYMSVNLPGAYLSSLSLEHVDETETETLQVAETLPRRLAKSSKQSPQVAAYRDNWSGVRANHVAFIIWAFYGLVIAVVGLPCLYVILVSVV